MKKIFSLIVTLLLLAGCDDGDMTYKSFDFTDAAIVTCDANEAGTQTYYKLTGTEGLILVLAPNALRNQSTYDPVSGKHIPYIITLSNTNTLTYKNYVSAPGTNGLCTLSTTPATTETWEGVGTLSVVTEAVYKNDILEGYAHVITMQSVSFKNNDETITINNSVFGRINKNYDFIFNFDIAPDNVPDVLKCTDVVTNFIYTVKDRELLSLYFEDFNAAFVPIADNVTTLPLGDDNNLIFTTYNGTVIRDRICPPLNGPEPIAPQPIEQWTTTLDDVGTAVAIITTSIVADQYVYDIKLKDVTLTNIITGENIKLSDIAEKDVDGNYYFGRYEP